MAVNIYFLHAMIRTDTDTETITEARTPSFVSLCLHLSSSVSKIVVLFTPPTMGTTTGSPTTSYNIGGLQHCQEDVVRVVLLLFNVLPSKHTLFRDLFRDLFRVPFLDKNGVM